MKAKMTKRIVIAALVLAVTVGACLTAWYIWFDDTVVVNGKRYRLAGEGYQQGISTILQVKESSGQWTTVGSANMDNPVYWLPVLRPKGAWASKLWITNSGQIAIVLDGNRCRLVYDPATGKNVRSSDIHELSPFMLLDDNSEINPDDLQGLLENLRSGYHTTGQPTKQSLEAGLTSKNSNIRSAAQQLLAATHSS